MPSPVVYKGYAHTGTVLETMQVLKHWVIIEEELDELGNHFGLIQVRKKNTTTGKVLAVGQDVDEDIVVGDRVLFEEWQGGRWNFETEGGGEVNALIMDEGFITGRIGTRDTPENPSRE